MLEGNFFYIVKFLPILAITAILFGLLGWWLRCKLGKCGATRVELEGALGENKHLKNQLAQCTERTAVCQAELTALKKANDSLPLAREQKEVQKANPEPSLEPAVKPTEVQSLFSTPAASEEPAPAANEPAPTATATAPTPGTAIPLATDILGKKVKQDDLKVMEGIGPKIEEILQNSDISTWVALSQSTPEAIKTILMAAGERYRIHDPGTWPHQASLAADGKWTELRELQDRLDGGKEVD